MRLKLYFRHSWQCLAALLVVLGAWSLTAAADDTTVDEYIADARPFLHHSCESAWAASEENPETYVGIINRFVAIVFINHEFDVQRIADAPAADQEQLRVIFYNEIGKRCQERPKDLLAGIVEGSLQYAFDTMKDKAG